MIVIDSIDFTWAQPSPNRSEPEDLIHDFMTLTGTKVGHVRADGAGDFASSSTFQAYCKRHNTVIEEVPAYTHTFNARVEGASCICKDKLSAFLRRANMPRRFWPDALLHWCSLSPSLPTSLSLSLALSRSLARARSLSRCSLTRQGVVLTDLCLVLVCRGRYGLGEGVLLFILGSSWGGVGPVRGLRGGGRGGCQV
jgi:hypothetical protein